MVKPTVIGIETGNTDMSDGNDGHAVLIDDDTGQVIPVVEPATIIGEPDQADNAPRKRGRPRGSRNVTTTAKQTKQTSSDLTGLLMGLHMMGAELLKIQELNLDESEAKRIAEALARLQSLYDMPVLTEKQMAWSNLVMACFAVYGTRIAAYKLRIKNEAAAAKAAGPGAVAGQVIPPGIPTAKVM